jgi:hypothetical protein
MKAGDVMIRTVVAVGPETPARSIAQDGQVIGIVSRADLVRTVAQTAPELEPSSESDSELPVASEKLAALGRHAQPHAPAANGGLSARAFRDLVHDFEQEEVGRREAAHRELVERHH